MDVRDVGETKIAVTPPRIDANTAEGVQESLATLIADGAKIILCDFSQTTYISSAGLRALLATAKELHKNQGKLALFSVSEYVQEILQISGLASMFPVHPTEEDALKATA